MSRSIAIVGIGGVFPGAAGLEVSPAEAGALELDSFWKLIAEGRSAAGEPPKGRWHLPVDAVYDPQPAAPDRVQSRRACAIRDFSLDPAGLDLEPEFLRGLDPMFHLALHAGRAAARGARLDKVDGRRVGVVFGNIALPTEASSRLAVESLGRTFEEKVLGEIPPASPRTAAINRYVAGLPAGVVAKALGFDAGTFTLDAACASSLYAIKLACDELSAGRADAMLAGGLSRPDPLYTQMGFSQLRALSPSGLCSPFDAKGDGLVVGEGAGMFALKRLEDALAASDEIYGVIQGVGLSNDVEGNLLAPSSEGQLRALRAAYASAGWSPEDVDLIECHATGTPVGDAVEFASLRSLWEGADWKPGQCVIGGVKSNVGHLLTGAGAAGLMKVLLALRHRTLPPTANFERPSPQIKLEGSPFRVLAKSEPWEARSARIPRRAAVSGFGFGGINAHLLVEQWLAPEPRRKRGKPSIPAGEAAGGNAPPVAIVGLGAHFGKWDDLRKFSERVLGGGEDHAPSRPRWWGVEESRWFREAGFSAESLRGHYIDTVDVPLGRFRIPPHELSEMLPQQLLMLKVAADAVTDAGWGRDPRLGGRDPRLGDKAARLDAGVFIGVGLDLNTTQFHLRWDIASKAAGWARRLGRVSSGPEFEEWTRRLQGAAGPALSANRTMGALGGIVASRVAREFRVGGPSFTIQSEESSGLRALEAAVRALRSGELNSAIVGAVDLAGDVRAVLGTHADRPYSASGSSRPFDSRGDGPVPGDGAGAAVLKRYEDALKDGDKIYAVIRGVGSARGGGVERRLPDPGAYDSALERAYSESGVEPSAVGLFAAQGSGAPADDRMEAAALGRWAGSRTADFALASAAADVGHCGAASGLASLLKAALCLYQEVLPPLRGHRRPIPELQESDARCRRPARARYWLRDKAAGPRRAAVNSFGVDGGCVHVVLEAHEGGKSEESDRLQPLGSRAEALFAVEADSPSGILDGLTALRQFASASRRNIEALARDWRRENPGRPAAAAGLALVARDAEELAGLITRARGLIERSEPASGRICFSPGALRGGKVAFVFPGSGNQFPGMGLELSAQWPEILRRQDGENSFLASQYVPGVFWKEGVGDDIHSDTKALIFGQVALGTFTSDLLRGFGVRPDAAIGYSLGETAGFYALKVWRDRDEMLRRMNASTLFTRDLAGPCAAARKVWKLPKRTPVDWTLGVLAVPAAAVRSALKGKSRVYLLIVNTPEECVIGGERSAVEAVVNSLGGRFLPLQGVTTVHCEAAEPVREAYRNLHLFDTNPPEGVRFYSGRWGAAYDVDRDRAADSITEAALYGVDYPKVIESAYADGVRVFLEMGPGASCTRMIGRILGRRPHWAASACALEVDGVSGVLRMLAGLVAERVPVDLDALYGRPSPAVGHRPAAQDQPAMIRVPVGGEPFELPEPAVELVAASGIAVAQPAGVLDRMRAVESANARTQETFLRLNRGLSQAYAGTLARQLRLLAVERPPRMAPTVSHTAQETCPPRALERAGCLEFARGSIARVLGPAFAEIDSHPTRVRLPDEPLMLVDRILSVEGEPRSLTSGRVVTEHDVRAGAWYLDGGRAPVCISVEAGQADLFLSGYLGIDFVTKGRAVYRLLDAVVTFHRGLPLPGETIRYDIKIERFFRQGETRLFRFSFEGTIAGKPLLTMTSGCAGFFTEAELAAGEGIVHTALDKRKVAGKRPADWEDFAPPVGVETLDAQRIEALRAGDLAACFGPTFSGLALKRPVGLPGGLMRLVDRVTALDPSGGRFGLGVIRAEADIRPGDWFLACHFVDDKVMPGTLMYECCLHTLRVLLMRIGWVGEVDSVRYEPIVGTASRLKCRGQVLETTRIAAYEISIKELGYEADGTPYAVADALMFADGKAIVEMTDMSVRLAGLTREALRTLWGRAPARVDNDDKPAIFDDASILAFAIGKPSEAFGEPYKVFDRERVIARLPGPPYKFLDRITEVRAEAWKLKAGSEIEAQYEVGPEEWYFSANRQKRMPFAVLLEVALQPCGWLAAFLGSALTSSKDLSFRNLGGTATQYLPVLPETGTLTTRVKMTKISNSGGMIIQHFDFETTNRGRSVYKGDTYFGFFSKAALATQVGIRDAKPYAPTAAEDARGNSFRYPAHAPYPEGKFRMLEYVDLCVPDGGPRGLGYARGSIDVDPAFWFFKAHFHQDPVWPGSLGLESLLQLMKVLAVERWGQSAGAEFECVALNERHAWTYRGQVLPSDSRVVASVWVTGVDDEKRLLRAAGILAVDGRLIYEISDFTIRVV